MEKIEIEELKKKLSIKENIIIKDSDDKITCRICGKMMKRLYGKHFDSHDITADIYHELFPNALIECKNTSDIAYKNGGKHMKVPKYKKMFSEMFSGENNPNHTLNTTEEVRRSRSPFSKDFIKYKDETTDDKRLAFIKENQKNIVSTTTIEYFLNKGYSEEVAKEMLSERQRTFSKKICFDKYGEKEGLKIFNERQFKWSKSLIENGNLKAGFSLISQELFEKIVGYYENEQNIYFAKSKINNEFFLSSKEYGYRIYDFVDLDSKKIIEFNGDVYHGNPEIYKEDDIPNPFKDRNKTAKEIWEYDKEKTELAKSRGFEVLTIWEKEYKKNKEETLNKCLNFLGIEKTTI